MINSDEMSVKKLYANLSFCDSYKNYKERIVEIICYERMEHQTLCGKLTGDGAGRRDEWCVGQPKVKICEAVQ